MNCHMALKMRNQKMGNVLTVSYTSIYWLYGDTVDVVQHDNMVFDYHTYDQSLCQKSKQNILPTHTIFIL